MKRLLELVLELHEQALAMVDQADGTDEGAEAGPRPAWAEVGQVRNLTIAQLLVRFRRSREAMFQVEGLFGDPAWDILLEIFIAENIGKRLSVTGACIGAAAPTTGLRWLRRLETEGLVSREHDGQDKRRIYVRLTPRATELMNRTLSQLRPFFVSRQEPAQAELSGPAAAGAL